MALRLSAARFIMASLIALAVTAAIGCSKGPAGTAQEGEPLKLGYMICNSRAETLARFTPLTEYLSQKIGRKMVVVPIDTTDFEAEVAAGRLDFTHTNSLVYVALNKNYGVEPLAGDVQGKYGNRTTGGIVVRADSPMKSISDLKGKRMVFGPMLAPTGYLAQYDLMLKDGFDPEVDLAFYTIPRGSYKHEKVVYGLMFGAFDAAAVPMLDFELMGKEGRVDPAEFRVIAESEPIPYCTFGATEKADDALAAKLKQALLALGPEDTVEVDGERVRVLKAAMLDGFADVKDSEYDVVREMAKRCNMPPYQKF